MAFSPDFDNSYGNGRQFFAHHPPPPVPKPVPPPDMSFLPVPPPPPLSSTQAFSSSPPRPHHIVPPARVPSVDVHTLAMLSNNVDMNLLLVDFYNALKHFPTRTFSSEVHENCIKTVKHIFEYFKENEKRLGKQNADLRGQVDLLHWKLTEKDKKIYQMQGGVDAKKQVAEDDGASRAMKMEYEKLTHDALNDITEKNRFTCSLNKKANRYKTVQEKYNALNVLYGNKSGEKALMEQQCKPVQQKIDDVIAEKAEDDLKMEEEENGSQSPEPPKLTPMKNREYTHEMAAEAQPLELAPKNKRGRKSKAVVFEKAEDDQTMGEEETESPGPPKLSSMKKRGRKSKEMFADRVEDVQEMEDELSEAEAQPPAPKKKRGRPSNAERNKMK